MSSPVPAPRLSKPWLDLNVGVRDQIARQLGEPLSVAENQTYANDTFRTGKLTSGGGDFFVKVSSNALSFEEIRQQIADESGLPALFPRPAIKGHNVFDNGTNRIIWLAHEWVQGSGAYTRLERNEPNVVPRLIDLAQRANLSATTLDNPDAYTKAGSALKRQYTGCWQHFRENPELLYEIANIGDLERDFLRENCDKFSQIVEDVLSPALTDTHIAHLDAATVNAFLSDVSPQEDVLIDGPYGLGPPWLTAFQLFEHAYRNKHITQEQFDTAVSQFGADTELIDAFIIGAIGHRCARSADLVPYEDLIIEGEPSRLEAHVAWLAKRLNRTTAFNDHTHNNKFTSPPTAISRKPGQAHPQLPPLRRYSSGL